MCCPTSSGCRCCSWPDLVHDHEPPLDRNDQRGGGRHDWHRHSPSIMTPSLTPQPVSRSRRYINESLLEPSRREDDEALQIVIADITKGVRHIARTMNTRTSTAYNRSPDVQLRPGDANSYVGRDHQRFLLRNGAGAPKTIPRGPSRPKQGPDEQARSPQQRQGISREAVWR